MSVSIWLIMKVWFWSGITNMALGVALGWVIFERPEWATRLVNRVKDWFKALWDKVF